MGTSDSMGREIQKCGGRGFYHSTELRLRTTGLQNGPHCVGSVPGLQVLACLSLIRCVSWASWSLHFSASFQLACSLQLPARDSPKSPTHFLWTSGRVRRAGLSICFQHGHLFDLWMSELWSAWLFSLQLVFSLDFLAILSLPLWIPQMPPLHLLKKHHTPYYSKSSLWSDTEVASHWPQDADVSTLNIFKCLT